MNIKELLKKTSFVNKLRSRKWRKLARKELFSKREAAFLEQNPEKRSAAIASKLAMLSNNTILTDLEKTYNKSPLQKRLDIDYEMLKEDMLFWHFAYGFTFNEYACYQFIDKSIEERKTFLSDRDITCLCYEVNDLRKMDILNDKAEAYKHFSKYYRREAISISKESDLDVFLEFIGKHKKFAKKLTNEACGRSVELIDLTNKDCSPHELFYRLIEAGKTILEELVIQSELFSAFNPSSVNTLRCITFNTKNGIKTPFFFMKTGRLGSFVDNGGAGGVFVAVDGRTGVLSTGTDEYGNRYSAHPDTGISFIGVQLPDWDEAVDMCIEMSSKLPEVRIIGWDLAHTENGWITIEGNSMTEIIGPQSTWLKGTRQEVQELCSLM